MTAASPPSPPSSSSSSSSSSPRRSGVTAVVVTATVCLAIAMGIGRFAFTPILPMMLHDGVIDLPSASWLASTNYLGYLLGALLCAFQPRLWLMFPFLPKYSYLTLVRAGLVATVLLTIGMSIHAPAAWPWLRFFAGIASAVVLMFVLGWSVTRLAEAGKSRLSGAAFAGPGFGIIASGVLASTMVQINWSSAAAWLLFGLLAAVLAACAWRFLDGHDLQLAPSGAHFDGSKKIAPNTDAPGQSAMLISAYGLAGFGYIITATFLPVIARTAMPGSPWLDLFWPVFGAGIVAGAFMSTRVAAHRDARNMLALCYLVQAMSIVVTLIFPTLAGFALGSFLLGIPFTAITHFALQEARRLRPSQVTAMMSAMTVLYGIGQIVGPPMASLLLRHASTQAQGFRWSLAIAAASLFLGTAMFLAMKKIYPQSPSVS